MLRLSLSLSLYIYVSILASSNYYYSLHLTHPKHILTPTLSPNPNYVFPVTCEFTHPCRDVQGEDSVNVTKLCPGLHIKRSIAAQNQTLYIAIVFVAIMSIVFLTIVILYVAKNNGKL